LLNSRHSAADGRRQSVGYELSADTVNSTDRLYTCATDFRWKE